MATAFAELDALPAVTSILAQFDRRKLASAVEVMIALLDAADPDPDLEDDDPDHEHDGREQEDYL